MNVELNEGERIDDLEFEGLRIIQNKNWFCFGIDSILLSDFAKEIKKNSIVGDLGTGTGIISILLSKKTNLKKIYGIEIQKEVAKMAEKSVMMNELNDKIEICNVNIKNLKEEFGVNYFDSIVTNPPYKKCGTGLLNKTDTKLISRHEIECTLDEILDQSYKVLKDKGSFYMVHRPDRLVDIMYMMRKYKIEPKTLKIVYSNVNSKPKLILVKGIKNGNAELKVDKPIYIYNIDGTYTDEILEIYNKK